MEGGSEGLRKRGGEGEGGGLVSRLCEYVSFGGSGYWKEREEERERRNALC